MDFSDHTPGHVGGEGVGLELSTLPPGEALPTGECFLTGESSS